MPGLNSPYIIYKCNTCNRETERQQDPRRPDPLRCTITLKCRGKLVRSGERAAKKFLFPSTSTNLIDWRARGTKVDQTTAILDPIQISLFTVRSGQGLTLAVKNGIVDSGSIVLYELTPELIKYKKFSYLINSIVQRVSGVDDSADRNNLRFTSQENIKVYVNGVGLESSKFDRTIDNEITFTPMITSINNLIEVVVYDDISSTITVDNTIRLSLIKFDLNDPARSNFTWGDTTNVKIENDYNTLLFCSDLSNLIQGRSYGLSGIELTYGGVTNIANPSDIKFLLGMYPFDIYDKDIFAYVKVTDLINDQVISYKSSSTSNSLEFTVSEDNITQITVPILPATIKTVNNTIETSTLSQGTSILKRKYTLGPI